MALSDGTRLTFERTLRPLRIGYRVDPGSPEELRRVVETATLHRGGRFHALIPVLERRPAWWNWPVPNRPSAKKLALDYARAFDCDFVVEAGSRQTSSAQTARSTSGSCGQRPTGMMKKPDHRQLLATGPPAAARYRPNARAAGDNMRDGTRGGCSRRRLRIGRAPARGTSGRTSSSARDGRSDQAPL